MPCTTNPFEKPLARPEVVPENAYNSACDSFRSSLSIDEGEGFPEEPIGHHLRCAPIPAEQAWQGLEIVSRDSLVDILGHSVRSVVRVCEVNYRASCIICRTTIRTC